MAATRQRMDAMIAPALTTMPPTEIGVASSTVPTKGGDPMLAYVMVGRGDGATAESCAEPKANCAVAGERA